MLNHAITAETLMGAIRDVAPVANQFNISFEKMLGIITATHVATRAKGERIGKAWRTILSRMATTARDKIQEIAGVGMYLDEFGKVTTKSTADIRNLGDALDEISLVFDLLTPKQKAQLGYAVAGRRRLELLSASMAHYEEGIVAEIEALTSWGASERAIQILMDTTRKKLDQIGASWRNLIGTMGETAIVKDILDSIIRQFERLGKAIAWSKGQLQQYLALRELEQQKNQIAGIYDEIIRKNEALINLSQKLVRYRELGVRIEERGIPREAIEKAMEKRLEAVRTGLESLGIPRENLEKDLDILTINLQSQIKDWEKEIRKSKIEQEFRLKTNTMQQELTNVEKSMISLSRRFADLTDIPLETFIEAPEQYKEAWLRAEDSLWQTKEGQEEITKIYEDYLFLKNRHITLNDDIINRYKTMGKVVSVLADQTEDVVQNVLEEAGYTIISKAEWENKLKEIEKEKDLGATTLEITKKKLDYLKQENNFYEDLGDQKTRELEQEIRHLELVERKNRMMDEISLTREKMTLEGYNELEIEMQYLALLEQVNAEEQTIYDQKQKIAQLALQSLQKEQQRLTNIYMQYEKAGKAERERLERVLELTRMPVEDLAYRYKKDIYDKTLVQDYWSYFSQEAQRAIAGVIGEEYGLPGAELFEERINLRRQVEDAFDVNIANIFANTWESSMIASLNRFKQAWLELARTSPEKIITPIEEPIKRGLPFKYKQEGEEWMTPSRFREQDIITERKQVDININVEDQTIKVKGDIVPDQVARKLADEYYNKVKEKLEKDSSFGNNIKVG